MRNHQPLNKLAWLIAIGSLVVLGCRPSDRVSSRLAAAVANASQGARITISDYTGFDWQYFVAFGPYTTREQAEAVLGFPWPGFERTGVEMSDSYFLLVFADNRSVIHAEPLPRCKPDFHASALGRRFSRGEASFRIVGSGQCDVLRSARWNE